MHPEYALTATAAATLAALAVAYFVARQEQKRDRKYREWIMEAIPQNPHIRKTGHQLFRLVYDKHPEAKSKVFYAVLKRMKQSGALRHYDSPTEPSGLWAIAVMA